MTATDRMTTDDKGLKPCPFCGGEASPDGVIRYSDSHVREQEWGQNEFYYCNCVRCGVSNRGLIGYRSQADAIAAWNRRHSPVLSAEDAALVERLDATQAVEILERNIVAGDIDDDTAVFIVAGLIGELTQLAPASRLEALSRREQELEAGYNALVAAGEKVLAGLYARIDAADERSVPVFIGIVDLRDELHAARALLSQQDGGSDATD